MDNAGNEQGFVLLGIQVGEYRFIHTRLH